MNKASKLLFFVFLLCCIHFMGCTEDDDIGKEELGNPNTTDCENHFNLGEIYSLDASKAFLPYPDSVSKVIFTNEQGEEFEGEVTYYDISLVNAFTGGTHPCPLDNVLEFQYKWKAEQKRIIIDIDKLDLELSVTISPRIYYEDYKQKLLADGCLFIIRPKPDTNTISQISIVVDPREYPNPGHTVDAFYEEYEVHGKMFEQVHVTHADANNDFELYYSGQVGIVGFKDILNGSGIDLKFDRIE